MKDKVKCVLMFYNTQFFAITVPIYQLSMLISLIVLSFYVTFLSTRSSNSFLLTDITFEYGISGSIIDHLTYLQMISYK